MKDDIMNFHEALAYIQELTKFGFNFGLDRIYELLRRLGNPHEKLKVIHVGGTNGKGSTTVMIASILQEAGYKVGVFTSPHLYCYTERVKINNQNISRDEFARLVTFLKPHLDQMVADGFEHPTEFEVNTALAILYFCRQQTDLVVLEVGLGGLIDSTNVVKPLVAVITNVAMDHMDYLGDSLTEIARVKAGIIKEGIQVITAADEPEAVDIIVETCRERRASLARVGVDIKLTPVSADLTGQVFHLQGLKDNYTDLTIKLLGQYQLVNAATAVGAVERLDGLGYRITSEHIRTGLDKARWPGRLEIVHERPLVLIDGAHNYHGAKALRQFLTQFLGNRRLILVIGMLGDKERERVLAELLPMASALVVTKPNSYRAGNWQEMADKGKEYLDDVFLEEDIAKAVKLAMAQARPEDLVVITGSLYMIPEARMCFTNSGLWEELV